MEEILDDLLFEKDKPSCFERLIDGDMLQIFTKDSGRLGKDVFINGAKPSDGLYEISEENTKYEIKNGEIVNEYYIEKYKQKDGRIIEIDASRINGILKKSKVWIDGKPAEDGIYRKNWFTKIELHNGMITKFIHSWF